MPADLDPSRIWTPRGFGPLGPNPLADMNPTGPNPLSTTQHNTTFLNNGKEKQRFRSNPAAFIIASRTVYARIRCEQTTAFERLKL